MDLEDQYDKLYRYCYFRVRDVQTAEDLVQEGMIGLFRAIQDFDPAKGAFGSFAKLCVQRQVISAVKASTRQKHQLLNEFVSFDARTDGQHALRDVLPGPQEEEPEALILQKQRLDEVHQAMETTLSELELEVLLRHISGESYQQIAMALDRPEKSVDNALQRIKNKLASFR